MQTIQEIQRILGGTIPPHVKLMLRKLAEEQKQSTHNQRMLGKKIPLNEKTVSVSSSLESLTDLYGHEKIEDHVTFTEPTVSRKEPTLFVVAKRDDE